MVSFSPTFGTFQLIFCDKKLGQFVPTQHLKKDPGHNAIANSMLDA